MEDIKIVERGIPSFYSYPFSSLHLPYNYPTSFLLIRKRAGNHTLKQKGKWKVGLIFFTS